MPSNLSIKERQRKDQIKAGPIYEDVVAPVLIIPPSSHDGPNAYHA
jgi:hypothetical protein